MTAGKLLFTLRYNYSLCRIRNAEEVYVFSFAQIRVRHFRIHVFVFISELFRKLGAVVTRNARSNFFLIMGFQNLQS